MVDQAQVTPKSCRTDTAVNRTTELPPRAVARNTAEFLHDLTTLAELQGKLLVVDLREGISNLVTSVVLLCAGAAIALGTIPIALAALAITLDEFTNLTPAACFGIALLVGVVLAALLAVPAIYAIRKGVWMFDRSQTEWRRNVQWAKDAMKRMH
jgi:hypothetical protein